MPPTQAHLRSTWFEADSHLPLKVVRRAYSEYRESQQSYSDVTSNSFVNLAVDGLNRLAGAVVLNQPTLGVGVTSERIKPPTIRREPSASDDTLSQTSPSSRHHLMPLAKPQQQPLPTYNSNGNNNYGGMLSPPQPPSLTSSVSQGSHNRSSSFFSSFRKDKDRNTVNGNGSVDQHGQMQHQPSTNNHTKHQSNMSMSTTTMNTAPNSQRPQHRHAASSSSQQQIMAPPPTTGSPPAGLPPVATQPLHPEIRSVVQLQNAHAHKVYFSGPLIRRIERQADGARPSKDDGWTDVWAQLGGTTLSIWDMKAVEEASKEGKEVPPTYVNTTDAVSSSSL